MSRRLRARAWLTAAAVAAVAIAIGAFAWPRQHFDMVKTLAAIAEQEGPWDNPWTVQEKKIGSLQADLRNPVALRRIGKPLDLSRQSEA